MDNMCKVPGVLASSKHTIRACFFLHISPPPLEPPISEASVNHQKLPSSNQRCQMFLSSSLCPTHLPGSFYDGFSRRSALDPIGKASVITIGHAHTEKGMQGVEAALRCPSPEVPFLETWNVSFLEGRDFHQLCLGVYRQYLEQCV